MKIVKLFLIAVALSAAFSSCLVVRDGHYHHYGYYR